MGGARWGGDTAGAYYGSPSAHSFFAQQLRALQKTPLPGLHFPLPSWTDVSSATHVAAVVGFPRVAESSAAGVLWAGCERNQEPEFEAEPRRHPSSCPDDRGADEQEPHRLSHPGRSVGNGPGGACDV